MSTGYKLCQRQNDKKPLKGANNTAAGRRPRRILPAGTMTNRSANRNWAVGGEGSEGGVARTHR